MPYTDTTTYIVVCSNDDTSNGYIVTSAAKRIDNQTVDLVSGLSGSYYQAQPVDIIVCGWQQWGELQAKAINTTITLPIAYEINHFAVVTSTTDSTGTSGLYTSNGCDRTLTTFRFACEATGGRLCCWISCGAQQWGGFVNGTNTFPIAFTTACYSMTGGGEGDWGGSDISLVSATTSTFTAERETNSTIGKWMALGR